MYQVAGSNGNYTVHPELAGGGYCPCPAYSQNVVAGRGNQIIVCSSFLLLVRESLDAQELMSDVRR